jgi:hypothetical protein
MNAARPIRVQTTKAAGSGTAGKGAMIQASRGVWT